MQIPKDKRKLEELLHQLKCIHCEHLIGSRPFKKIKGAGLIHSFPCWDIWRDKMGHASFDTPTDE